MIFELAHRARCVRWIGSEHFLVHDPAHARIAHGLHRDAARASVGVRGDARLDSLDDAETGGGEHRFAIHDLVPALPEPVYPLRELTILEEAAHCCELEVRVGVDEAGKENRFAEVVVLAWRGGGARPNI